MKASLSEIPPPKYAREVYLVPMKYLIIRFVIVRCTIVDASQYFAKINMENVI